MNPQKSTGGFPRAAVSAGLLAMMVLLAGCETVPTATAPTATTTATAKVRVYDLEEVDQKPVASYQQRPRYPVSMRRNGISGGARVRFVIDTDGTVHDARSVEATHPDFGVAAVQAVSGWKFKPGVKNGQPVVTRMSVPIMFTVNEES